MNGASFLSIRYNSRTYRGPGIGGSISLKRVHDRRTDSRKFLDGIWQERRRLQFHKGTSSILTYTSLPYSSPNAKDMGEAWPTDRLFYHARIRTTEPRIKAYLSNTL